MIDSLVWVRGEVETGLDTSIESLVYSLPESQKTPAVLVLGETEYKDKLPFGADQWNHSERYGFFRNLINHHTSLTKEEIQGLEFVLGLGESNHSTNTGAQLNFLHLAQAGKKIVIIHGNILLHVITKEPASDDTNVGKFQIGYFKTEEELQGYIEKNKETPIPMFSLMEEGFKQNQFVLSGNIGWNAKPDSLLGTNLCDLDIDSILNVDKLVYEVFKNRFSHRYVTKKESLKEFSSLGFCYGVDLGTVVPPFFPFGSNFDSYYSYLVHVTNPSSDFMLMPYSVCLDPSLEPKTSEPMYHIKLKLSDLLFYLCADYHSKSFYHSLDFFKSYELFGNFLQELTTTTIDEFKDYLRSILELAFLRKKNKLAANLAKLRSKNTTVHSVRDLDFFLSRTERELEALTSFFNDSEWWLPTEYRFHRDSKFAFQSFQKDLTNFASALKVWPKCFHLARV
ncbi:hypothetical protein P3G55_09885 [Leptospira sp. 96542]|nr:hypothetical protein [Leptospira sp. 96542]